MWMCPNPRPNCCDCERRLQDGRLSRDAGNLNKVELILEDGAKYPMEGTLQFRDVSVDQTTGSVIADRRSQSRTGTLLPGMFVRAVIEEGNEHAILVPQQAVSRDPKGNPLTLIVDDNGKVQQRGCWRPIAPWATNGLSPRGLPRRSRDRRGHAKSASRNER
jgi:multidrug efflux pump subunit AcrA (membrane-fusion protein)